MSINAFLPPIRGCIFDIREFSLFDGPGVRTTVFLKGCPLRCVWCHNPEGLNQAPEILFSKAKCVHCNSCKSVCPSQLKDRCVACGKCALACPTQARRLCGQFMTSEELLDEVLRSQPIFESSNGGVTFSGGEPLAQIDFVEEASKALHEHGVHVAVETSGFSSAQTYKRLLDSVDLVFQDVKHTDDETHRRYTGVSNVVIFENLEGLKRSGKPFIIRVPLIPTVNDSQENLRRLAEKLRDASCLQRVELLPYHSSSGGKYDLLNLTPTTFQEKTFGNEVIEPFKNCDIPVRLL
ncbi:MAG: glycyl-radical enzyme activating protein [Thermoguttaceae bacterium]|nr:glycyl-radical enzyme activating protein [Thermoguttaceae bacterium]